MRKRTVVLPLLLLIFLSQITLAKDEWISVTSKNFNVIGNAKEKEIKAVVSKLEQFRHVFGLLFPKIKLVGAAESNVIVFKDEKSFKPFLPKRPDGKPDDEIAGYFLSREDINYIVLSTEGRRENTYKTIFHEYVHFLLRTNFERSSIPAWLNEGLAEYYSTFEIEDDQIVYLGNLRNDHLAYLARSSLIPLRDFFKIDNYSLHRNGNHSRSVYYAQAWALIHYFAVQGKIGDLSKYIELSKNGVEPEEAFNQALGFSYDTMQSNLRSYVEQRKFTRLVAKFNEKLVFESEMRVAGLDEATTLAFQGDLHYRSGEYVAAEVLLKEALALSPENVRANTAMGLIRMRLRDFVSARTYLEKAVAGNSRNAFSLYSLAYALSREGMDESGIVKAYTPEHIERMSRLLNDAIVSNPSFAPSYHLLSFVNVVSNQKLDHSLTLMNKAIGLQPGNLVFQLMKAQIYLRQEKPEEAEKIASTVMLTADNEEVRSSAQGILRHIERVGDALESRREFEKQIARQAGVDSVTLVERKTLTPEQIEKYNTEREISDMNRQLPETRPGEERFTGYLEKVTCSANLITYEIRTDNGNIILTSKDFQELDLLSVSKDTYDVVLGCDTKLSKTLTVFIYMPAADNSQKKGVVRAMTFVPKHFRLKSEEEMSEEMRTVIIN